MKLMNTLLRGAKMCVPVVRGQIDRRLLIGVRIDPEIAAKFIPRPLQPKVVNGWNIGGVCLIRLRHMRLKGLPTWCGMTSENAAHRFAVQWLENGAVREGVYIPDRDTNSELNHLVGGRLFPGIHHRADFNVWESEGRFRVGYDRRSGGCSVKVVARRVDGWLAGSVFESLNEASEFYRQGNIGWSDSGDGYCVEGMRLECPNWQLTPLLVERFESSYLQDPKRFPAGSVEFDSGLLMQNLDHDWRTCGVMNVREDCGESGKPIRGRSRELVPV